MPTTDLEIAQAALVLLRARPIASFTAQGRSAEVLRTLYEPTIRGALANSAWTFAKKQQVMTRTAEVPPGRWDASYQIPTLPPPIAIHTVLIGDDPIRFDRFEDKIYCDAGVDDEVICEYFWRVGEEYWPDDFVEYAATRLAARIAVPITGKPEIMTALREQADGELQTAALNASKGRTTARIRTTINRRRG